MASRIKSTTAVPQNKPCKDNGDTAVAAHAHPAHTFRVRSCRPFASSAPPPSVPDKTNPSMMLALFCSLAARGGGRDETSREFRKQISAPKNVGTGNLGSPYLPPSPPPKAGFFHDMGGGRGLEWQKTHARFMRWDSHTPTRVAYATEQTEQLLRRERVASHRRH